MPILRAHEEFYYRCPGCQAAFSTDDAEDPERPWEKPRCGLCGESMILGIRRIKKPKVQVS